MKEGLIAMQVYIAEDKILTGYNILLHKLLKLEKIYRSYNRRYISREFALHLWNMGIGTREGYELIYSYIHRIWKWFHKPVSNTVYRIRSIKHIFSYNKQNKVGQMSLLILKYS